MSNVVHRRTRLGTTFKFRAGSLLPGFTLVFRGSSSILGKTRVGGLTAPRSSRKSNMTVQTTELWSHKNSNNSNLDWSPKCRGERIGIQLFKITVSWKILAFVVAASSDYKA